MLERIFIQNFALIERLELSLSPGLQVITGETGAGKSIILGALRLILGERADAKAVSESGEKSIVEAEFRISEKVKAFFEENDLDYDSQTLIRREILPSGKSRAFINDVPVTLEVLRSLSSKLIDIHSQFETSELFSQEYQFKILDGLAGNYPLLSDYQAEFTEYQKLKQELKRLKTQLAEGNKTTDYNRFLLNELEEMQLDELDYEDLQQQLATLENAELISEQLFSVISKFNAEEVGVISSLNDARMKLTRISELSPRFDDLKQRLEETYFEIKDILGELESGAENLEINPELLASLTSVNNRLNALFLKHGAQSIDELVEIREELAAQESSFEDMEGKIADAEKSLTESYEKLMHLSGQLSENRTSAAPVFSEKTESVLKRLGLGKAKITAELAPAAEPGPFGGEEIGIFFRANSGFPLRPIQSAISGGERSRVMLAIKKIMAENSALPTLILDEIDTGVSGKVAEEIGSLMKEMSRDLQLVVITHLAQVAAKGDANYKVVKSDMEGKTRTTVIPLSADEKLTEIAQLLSGAKITDAALEQAKELMK
ncbi:DNA replication and repair protein RecN [Cruoricaptor ignavus]|uniref:DNA repair protein RecN n=1 Tax=Cruoricaptor ignavus TaxID=1118202 RepID=A0A1M6DKX1_9FLAO|nr:DNA repair protein RecN [Cruoricaptor ignavus]SHI73964.1 DNA replication and repair protein RecN [Cruoricaptor ignavus]